MGSVLKTSLLTPLLHFYGVKEQSGLVGLVWGVNKNARALPAPPLPQELTNLCLQKVDIPPFSLRAGAVCVGGGGVPSGVQRFRSLRLYSLSASFTSLAAGLLWGACSTCSRFLSNLGRVLSSVTSSTKRRTCVPKCSSTSSKVVSVSSTVSWSRAAWGTGFHSALWASQGVPGAKWGP